MTADSTYEMLWDCGFCGAEKLLGLTHRHCPACGAPQDADARYFPADADRIAVEDHVFVGADRLCPACGAAASARAEFCAGCGSPLGGAAPVAPRVTAAAKPAPKPPSRSRGAWLAGGVALLALTGVGVVQLWTRDVELRVIGHRWERQIEIEQLQQIDTAEWCDALPEYAYEVTRTREVRSQRRVGDGETCTTRKLDQGDGTYRETQECQPKYREEPVYDEKCHFTVDRWARTGAATAAGNARQPAPQWPVVTLARTGDCLGCEREGARSESYWLRLSSDDHDTECDYRQERWQRAETGDRWRGRAKVVTSAIDCASLEPSRSGQR